MTGEALTSGIVWTDRNVWWWDGDHLVTVTNGWRLKVWKEAGRWWWKVTKDGTGAFLSGGHLTERAPAMKRAEQAAADA